MIVSLVVSGKTKENFKKVEFIFYDVLVYFFNIVFLLIFLEHSWRNILIVKDYNEPIVCHFLLI